MPKNISYFWKNIDSSFIDYISDILISKSNFKALIFLRMRRTVVSIIFKSKCILCRRHYGQITIETPLYNFCYFKNLKYFLPLLAYCWTTPLCHRKGNIGGCHYNRVVKVCFSESLALVSCAEDPFGFKNDWNYSGWAYPNLQTFSSNNWIMQYCSKATSWR